MEITEKRRAIQEAHNQKHGIIPKTAARAAIEELAQTFGEKVMEEGGEKEDTLSAKEIQKKIDECYLEMRRAAKEMRFEDAAGLRDEMQQYQKLLLLEESL